jgi:hypothetical protein
MPNLDSAQIEAEAARLGLVHDADTERESF